MEIEIKNVNYENLDDFINICIPKEKRYETLFKRGFEEKRKWCEENLKIRRKIGKIAYLNNNPVGMIQYIYKDEENIVEILCIFVPEKENLRKGIGKKLLLSLRKEIYSENFFKIKPLAIINFPIDISGRFKESDFLKNLGFFEIIINNNSILYYPLKENYNYEIKEEKYYPQEEDESKAIIFYNPSCPFCIYFSENIKNIIKEIKPEIEVRLINKFFEKEEVKKRGIPYSCIVNKIPIKTFFLDKENFKKEIMNALNI